MNDPLNEFEAELRRCQPKAPDPGLESRLAQQLAQLATPATSVFAKRAWLWLPLAASACLVLSGIRWLGRPHATNSALALATNSPRSRYTPISPKDQLRQVRMANYLIEAEDEGVVYASATAPLRKIHYRYLATSEWKDKDNTTVEVFVPAEETVVVPLDVH